MFRNCEALFRNASPGDILEYMVGQTITSVDGLTVGSERVVFSAESGDVFVFWHHSDCCESVEVNQIDGDVADLIGTPLLMAEQVDSDDTPARDEYESFTWTFYKFATTRGYVTVRWYGSSNGYYSEEVDVAVLPAGHSRAIGHYGSDLDEA